ncbi:hypothetical protein RRG08_015791 [Elysia crispata]|uniref:Uncharacterized protein n=1 Tax=Elysia crispata TaxID=231223 RepID=A0AAE1CRP8_9GAST|nr:hypothetical protein RRG08_015791 [Elysia crispata]
MQVFRVSRRTNIVRIVQSKCRYFTHRAEQMQVFRVSRRTNILRIVQSVCKYFAHRVEQIQVYHASRRAHTGISRITQIKYFTHRAEQMQVFHASRRAHTEWVFLHADRVAPVAVSLLLRRGGGPPHRLPHPRLPLQKSDLRVAAGPGTQVWSSASEQGCAMNHTNLHDPNVDNGVRDL